MKTLKLLGMVLLTVLLSVCVSACVGSDDDNGGGGSAPSVSIEGTWHPKSQIWYKWDKEKDAPNYSKSYTLDNEETWILTKTGDNYIWRFIYIDKGREYDETRELIRNKENDYAVRYNNKTYSRIVINSVSKNSIQLEYWDGYYREEGTEEYGKINLTR